MDEIKSNESIKSQRVEQEVTKNNEIIEAGLVSAGLQGGELKDIAESIRNAMSNNKDVSTWWKIMDLRLESIKAEGNWTDELNVIKSAAIIGQSH